VTFGCCIPNRHDFGMGFTCFLGMTFANDNTIAIDEYAADAGVRRGEIKRGLGKRKSPRHV
jgi:hypothetical protein